MRAAIYARVSSAAQRDRDTIAAQLRDLPAFIAAQGWTLAGTYVDDGKSAATGKLDRRDGFARLAADAERGLFDVVVVRHIDRLTRTDDMRERAEILGAFQRANVQVATPGAGMFDLRSMLGELYVTLQAMFAAEERRKIVERTVGGQERAYRLGRKGRGKTPFGLTYQPPLKGQPERWGIDPERAAIAREVVQRIADGDRCVPIADDLNRRGAPRRGTGPWTRHLVYQVVASDYLTGTWTTGGHTLTVPQIVEPALLARAREAVKARRFSGLDRTQHVYLLGGIAKCGKCGQNIRVRCGYPRGVDYLGQTKYARTSQYRCVGRWSPLPPGAVRCDAPSFRVTEADERAWAAISQELLDPDLVPALVAVRAERSSDVRDWKADVAGYEKHLARLTAAEVDTLGLLQRGKASADAVEQALAKLHREREMVTEQIAFAERARGAAVRATRRLSDAEAIIARLRGRLATATPEERCAIVAELVDPGGVVLDGDEIRIEMWVERPAVEDLGGSRGNAAPPAAMAGVQASRITHDCHLRIRVVVPKSRAA